MLWTIRLTDTDVSMLSNFMNWALGTKAVVHFCVFEISSQGKEHIHMLIDIPVKHTWVEAFHKFFNKRWCGNKAYSCTKLVKTANDFFHYCCKGLRNKPPEVWYALADYNAEEAWKTYWSDKPVESDFTLKLDGKPKVTKPSWSEELTKLIVKDSPGRAWRYNAHDVDEIIDRYVMPRLGANSKKLNPRIIADLVMGQLNALCLGRCESLNALIRRQGFPDLFG